MLLPITFACFTVPLFFLTMVSYYCLGCGFLTIYILKFTSQEFLVLRTKTFAYELKCLARTLNELKELERDFKRVGDLETVAKIKAEIRETKEFYVGMTKWVDQELYQMWRQFENANKLFDSQLTPSFLACLFCGFLFPIYFFYDLDLLTQVKDLSANFIIFHLIFNPENLVCSRFFWH